MMLNRKSIAVAFVFIFLLAYGAYSQIATSCIPGPGVLWCNDGTNIRLSDTSLGVSISSSPDVALLGSANVFTGANSFSATNSFNRIRSSQGTALVSGDFALSAGWGTTASVGTLSGNDMRGSFTVTSAGTGQLANPTITLTFTDGAFTSTPEVVVARNGGDQATLAIDWTKSTTQIVITLRGTPVATQTFSFSFITLG